MKQAMNLSIESELVDFIKRYSAENHTNVSAIVESLFRKLYANQKRDESWIDRFVDNLPDIEIPEEDPKLNFLKEKYLN